MTTAIRRPEPGEMDAVYLAGADVWQGDLSRADYLAGCRASPKYARGSWRGLFKGADAPAELLAALIIYELHPGVFGIGSVATPPERRGRGHASALIQRVVAGLESDGARAIFLHSDVAPTLYERLGFVALPAELQRKPGSSCMVRCADPAGLWSRPGFEPPRYF